MLMTASAVSGYIADTRDCLAHQSDTDRAIAFFFLRLDADAFVALERVVARFASSSCRACRNALFVFCLVVAVDYDDFIFGRRSSAEKKVINEASRSDRQCRRRHLRGGKEIRPDEIPGKPKWIPAED